MGNKMRRPKENTRSKVFLNPRSSIASISLTIPSICTSPSFRLSMQQSTTESESDAFNWHQMQSVYVKQEHLRVNHLTSPILKVIATGLEVLKRHIGEICGDLQAGTLKMPDTVVDRFGTLGFSFKTHSDEQLCTPGLKKLMTHFVKLLYIHDMILNYFRTNEIDAALDLIKQVAINHAVMGVLPVEFRMMDYFIAHYLIKNKVISDESINHLIMYLSIVSNYVGLFYQSQSVRFNMLDALTTQKENDRDNKARENFRLMKKWKKLVAGIRDQDHYVDQLLNEQMQLRRTEEDERSIDTLTLKRNDFIMKHFVTKQDKRKGSFT